MWLLLISLTKTLRKMNNKIKPGDADESYDLERLVQEQKGEDLVEFEFKVTGMTCVACSSSIERLMHNEFDAKGMKSVAIVLLTHKMTATFEAKSFNTKQVTPEMICDEVEMIGFDAELAGITEIGAEDLQPMKTARFMSKHERLE